MLFPGNAMFSECPACAESEWGDQSLDGRSQQNCRGDCQTIWRLVAEIWLSNVRCLFMTAQQWYWMLPTKALPTKKNLCVSEKWHPPLGQHSNPGQLFQPSGPSSAGCWVWASGLLTCEHVAKAQTLACGCKLSKITTLACAVTMTTSHHKTRVKLFTLGNFFEKVLTNRMNARPTWQTSAAALIKCVPTGVGIRSCTGTCIRQKKKKKKKKEDGEIDSASLDVPLHFCSLIATS